MKRVGIYPLSPRKWRVVYGMPDLMVTNTQVEEFRSRKAAYSRFSELCSEGYRPVYREGGPSATTSSGS